MARPDARHPDSVEGDWYADTRCIACDAARHYAPDLIVADDDGLSVVIRQPSTPAEEAAMWRATVACPTQSIGTVSRRRPPPDVFPWAVTDIVELLGHNDAAAPSGPTATSSPVPVGTSWSTPRVGRVRLRDAIADRGGLAHVLLTHRDDVADAQRYAEEFSARVWIHHADASAAPFATDVVTGDEPVVIAEGVTMIPTPGHTRGSVVFLVDGELLFTGDTLHLDEARGRLDVFSGATWFSWDELAASMARLAHQARFRWGLPGHGKWGQGEPESLHADLAEMAAAMTTLGRSRWRSRT